MLSLCRKVAAFPLYFASILLITVGMALGFIAERIKGQEANVF